MNRIDQTVIIETPKYMITEVCNVYRTKGSGEITGRLRGLDYPVVYDKVNNVWRLTA